MLYGRPTLGGSVRSEDDGRMHVVPGLPKGEVLLPALLFRPGGRVTGFAPPLPEQYWPGATVR